MALDLLKRKLAPIAPPAFAAVDAEAARVLRLNLAARRIVDFRGPHGWELAAVNTGRLTMMPVEPDRGDDVHFGIRQTQALVEVRVPIQLPIMELDSIARGAPDPDLRAVVAAAERVAHFEDAAIFNGLGAAGIVGIIPASPHRPHALPANVTELPRAILAARETLRQAGIDGPYALVLDAPYTAQVLAAAEDGYPLAKRLTEQVLDGPLVRAAAIEGGVLLSVRGGDYELTVGQDLSIGYAAHDRQSVELYLTESFTFRVLEAVAAVRLTR
ncbi:MAG TPA: family 1 encapsulin nanocompartment shell protein [Polyangia bacterium]|nr:family 1 encapsulin nanocompartment shell protein [Polyangia bacterium]